MNIEVEGCGDVGMTEQHTYSLVIAVALYAARRKAVAQPVVFQPWNAKTHHQTMIMAQLHASYMVVICFMPHYKGV